MVRSHNPSEVSLCKSDYVIVQSTIDMYSMLMLGGLGACPPRKFLKSRCCEIESEGILESTYLAIQCVLTCKINVK